MKIAHIVSTYPPYYGGMGNVVFHTASELTKLGHEVMVFTPDRYEAKEIRPQEKMPAAEHEEKLQKQIDYARRLKPSIKYGNAARLPQVRHLLDEFDLVHLHYPFFGTANLVRKWKIRNPRKPLVITYHMDARGPGWLGLVFKFYAQFWLPRILGSADKLIGSSLDYIESSQAGEWYRQQPDKWVGLPFGVDTDRFQPRPKPESLLARHNLDADIPTVLFVGGMDAAHYFKGIDVLLKALLILKKQRVTFQAVLVGEGELREKYQLSAISYQLQDYVRFVGGVSDEELPRYYNLADLFVLPSIHQGEAFGTVLLEAMASGVPVVASDLPGVSTVAKDGGLTFLPNNPPDLAEAIMGFFSDNTDRVAWRKKARQTAEEKYSWEMIVGSLEEVYNNLAVK